jgi:ABC-type transport system involved in multi-copper enzyme maturation permease subunit
VTATLGRIWAIAAMTLIEARRRKVFVILLLFAAALVSSVTFFPAVTPQGRIRLIEMWSLRAAGLFTAIVALFVAGFSLPGDFEQKRVYLVVTKPVSKVSVFVGRYLGFLLLLAAFCGLMGIITVVFMRGVQLVSGGSSPALAAYPRTFATAFRHDRGVQNPNPKFADEPAYEVLAENKGVLTWEFHGLRARDYEDSVRCMLTLELMSPADPYRSSGEVKVVARDPRTLQSREAVLFLQTNHDETFTFPSALIGPSGSLEISVECADNDGALRGQKPRVVLFERPSSFEWNFLKGMLLVLLQAAVVLSVTLMASTRVSAPVSILAGILVTIVGSLHGFAAEGTRDIDRSLAQKEQHGHKHGTPEGLPEEVLRSSSAITKVMLFIVPNFDQYDFSRWLLKDLALSWREIGLAALYAAPPIVATFLLGMLLLAVRDFQ